MIITTEPAIDITDTSAQLEGTVNATGEPFPVVRFAWWIGTTEPATPNYSPTYIGGTVFGHAWVLTGLAPGTTVSYYLRGSNSTSGVVKGATRSFVTTGGPGGPPGGTARAEYLFVLCELDTVALKAAPIGAIDGAKQRRWSGRLKKLDTASFTIDARNPMTKEITSRRGDVMLKVYQDIGAELAGALAATGNVTVNSTRGFPPRGVLRILGELISYTGTTATQFTGCTRGAGGTTAATAPDKTVVMPLRFFGDLLSYEEVGKDGEATLSCVFLGTLRRLEKRLCAKIASTEGEYFTGPRGTIVKQRIEATNAERDSGIRPGLILPSYDLTTGPHSYKPIAGLAAEIAAAAVIPFEVPTTYTGRDDFNAHAAGTLTGKVPQNGTAWANETAGGASTRGWATQTSGGMGGTRSIARGAVASPQDAASWPGGHWAYIDPNTQVPTLSALRYWTDFVGSTSDAYIALYARSAGPATGWVMAVVAIASKMLHFLRWTGSATEDLVPAVPLTGLAAGFWYAMRLAIDENGGFAIWHYDPVVYPNGQPPVMAGSSPHLAAGGARGSGNAGIYTRNSSQYGNFVVDDYFNAVPGSLVLAEPLDFAVVPTEPLPDTNQGGVVGNGVQVAFFDMPGIIGTTRPDAIFELSMDSSTMKDYRRTLDKEGLMNQGHILPAQEGITARDQASIDGRGLWEDVIPSDLGNALLRKAFLDAHLGVRKTARELFNFSPGGEHAPIFGVDYLIGDNVEARVKIDGESRFDGLCRVHGVDVTLGEEGQKDVVPALVSEA